MIHGSILGDVNDQARVRTMSSADDAERGDHRTAAPCEPLRIARRLGLPPSARGSSMESTCPDVFELSDGRFAVIGTDMTADLLPLLPADAGCAPYERVVVISRETMLAARPDIPLS